MTDTPGESPRATPPRPEVHELGQVIDGQRWNGHTWEPAGGEGIASATAPSPDDKAGPPEERQT
ncbi:MAG TPA: hypothetical protein VF143_07735 [Candidatus Nanopelagicales bacterium]